jgi:hypothetical protein
MLELLKESWFGFELVTATFHTFESLGWPKKAAWVKKKLLYCGCDCEMYTPDGTTWITKFQLVQYY